MTFLKMPMNLSFGAFSAQHLHHGLDILTGAILIVGATVLYGLVSRRLQLPAKAITALMYGLCCVLAVGGVDEIANVFVSLDERDPFSVQEWFVATFVAVLTLVVFPWVFLRFLSTRRAVRSLRLGLEETIRVAQRAQSESLNLSERYAESTDALRRSIERAYRLASLVESSRDAIVGINEDGTVWQWNEAAEALFKQPGLAMIGKSVSLIRVNSQSDLWREIQRFSAPPFNKGGNEISVVRGDGSTLPVWVSVSRVPAGAGGAAGFAIVARDLSDNKRVEEKISAALFEKNLLLKEVHHRVKNNLQLICSLLRLQATETSDEEALRLFRKSEDRIRSLALVHERLYRSENLSTLDFGGYVRDLVGQLVRSAELGGAAVSPDYDVASIFFPVDNAITCGLIVNELVANSLKHRTGPQMELRVKLFKDSTSVTFSVWDSGGAVIDPELFEHPKTLGLKLVRSLTRQLGGCVTVHQDGGTEFRVVFPASVLLSKESKSPSSSAAA